MGDSKKHTGSKISYKGLRKQMFNLNIKNKDLHTQLNLSSSTIAKLSNDKIVSLKVLMRLCEFFDCDIGDLVCYRKEMTEKEVLIEGLETLKLICEKQKKEKLTKILTKSIIEIKNNIKSENGKAQK